MSFAVFLQRFDGREGGESALEAVAPFIAGEPEDGYARIVTGDGEADVYGLGTGSLMIDHASGKQIWQLMFDVAQAAGYVIMPVGCPTCIVDPAMLMTLPEELREDVALVTSGEDVLRVVQTA